MGENLTETGRTAKFCGKIEVIIVNGSLLRNSR